jgi:hypothetical protein
MVLNLGLDAAYPERGPLQFLSIYAVKCWDCIKLGYDHFLEHFFFSIRYSLTILSFDII